MLFQFDKPSQLQDWTVMISNQRRVTNSCSRMELRPYTELWFEAGPHHDQPRGVGFILWSKNPDKDVAAWRSYLQLRADQNLLDPTAAQITAQVGPPTHVLPTWPVPIHAGVLQDAAWSPGVIRTYGLAR
ncbi:hypothetical protein TI39_contig4524g00001 [Zymoseptoria brevis]|uniref:Uncharacterized protein n=1 Tax=Zymoseptoria brevis TaxID=1047168 RepID=A0A0F4G9P1_9PEZI|nr:hypothetical protein TI39_contig4524g00001 [Zymoseptoria brevis]